MNDNDDNDPEWDLSLVKPVTRSLIEAIAFDIWPTPAAANDFGIVSQQHYEAIYYPVRNDEITFAELDAAYGNGPDITVLVNAATSNPHKGIRFETPWDHILPRGGAPEEGQGNGGKLRLSDLKKEAAQRGGDKPAPQKDRAKEPER